MRAVVITDDRKMAVDGAYAEPEAGEGQVLIRVHYSAINRADTLQRKGNYSPPPGASPVLGLECSGEVAAVGPGCARGFKAGDRVMALLTGGGYAEMAVAHEGSVMRVPDGMSLRDAAAVPETWLTAFQLLGLGRAGSGDTVLVHAAGSGVGSAAIQLAALRGAVPYGTAGSAAKLEHARELGARAAWNYKEEDFGDAVLAATGGRGVDVVLDCVGGGPHLGRNGKAVATDGRWVLYGLMGGTSFDGITLATVLRKRVSLVGTTLRARTDAYKAELVRCFVEEALPLFADGKLRTVVDSEYALADVNDAHAHMESNANTGKILLRVVG